MNFMSIRRRRRRGRTGRQPKPIRIGMNPSIDRFIPYPQRRADPVYIDPTEIEVLRLVDLEGLSQLEAGHRMGVSRGTVWRLLQSARTKTPRALTEARQLIITQ